MTLRTRVHFCTPLEQSGALVVSLWSYLTLEAPMASIEGGQYQVAGCQQRGKKHIWFLEWFLKWFLKCFLKWSLKWFLKWLSYMDS